MAGCLTDDLQGGVRITRTYISNLTTRTEETKTPPAFLHTDGETNNDYEQSIHKDSLSIRMVTKNPASLRAA